MNDDRDMDVDMVDVDAIGDDEQQEVEVASQLRPEGARSTPSYASGSISRGSTAAAEHSSHMLFPPYDSGRAASASSSSLGISAMLNSVTDSPSTAFSRSPSMDPGAWYPFEPSEERKFRLLYVPDASRWMSRSAAERNLAWTKREIRSEQYEAIKNLSGFVYKYGVNRNGIRVLLTEWVGVSGITPSSFWS